jgi:hypothetical protein
MRRVWLMRAGFRYHFGGAMGFFHYGRFLQVESGAERLARPRKITTRCVESALAASSASDNSVINSIVRALRRSGRLRVTMAVRFFFSTRTLGMAVEVNCNS